VPATWRWPARATATPRTVNLMCHDL
jgi:hypothetical protein